MSRRYHFRQFFCCCCFTGSRNGVHLDAYWNICSLLELKLCWKGLLNACYAYEETNKQTNKDLMMNFTFFQPEHFFAPLVYYLAKYSWHTWSPFGAKLAKATTYAPKKQLMGVFPGSFSRDRLHVVVFWKGGRGGLGLVCHLKSGSIQYTKY